MARNDDLAMVKQVDLRGTRRTTVHVAVCLSIIMPLCWMYNYSRRPNRCIYNERYNCTLCIQAYIDACITYLYTYKTYVL